MKPGGDIGVGSGGRRWEVGKARRGHRGKKWGKGVGSGEGQEGVKVGNDSVINRVDLL